MSKVSRGSRIAYLTLLLLALLIVPTLHAQDSSDQILYTVDGENRDNTVYTVNVDDGTKTQIGVIHNLYDAGWSPDGKFIYLLDYEKEFGIRVTLLDIDTNRRQTLPDPLNDIVCWLPIWWSPDSQWLAYTAAPNPNPIRKIYNPKTSQIQVLPDADVRDDLIYWSPNSRYLAYKVISEEPTYKFAIWDVQKQHVTLVINVNGYPSPQWSPTDSRIAFQDADSNTVIIYDISDGTKQEYENSSIENWSPDGRFLIIERTDKNNHTSAHIIDTLTQKPVELDVDIAPIGGDARITWSSNSRYLVTSARDKDNSDNIIILIVDVLKRSIESTKISVPDYGHLRWSPQGNRFTFTSNTEYLDDGPFFTSLWLYDVDNQQSHHYVTKISGYYYGPVQRLNWSPTGLYITVQADSGFALLNWTTKQLKPIRIDGQGVGQPRWSPDGTQLALGSGEWDTGDLYVFVPKDNTVTNLTHTPDEGETFLGWRGANQNDSMIGPCGET